MSHPSERTPVSAPSPFEQASALAYDMHNQHHSHNTLVVPPFGEEAGGIVLPVVTTLKYQELPKHNVQVHGIDIGVSQQYPVLTASATYVGLWPNGERGAGTAAVYETKTTFTPNAFEEQLPFRETMNDLLVEFSTIEQTGEADVKGAVPITPPHVRGTADTELVPRSAGYNSVEKTRFWRPALSGTVVVELAADRIVKITDSTLLAAAQAMIDLELTGGDEQTILDRGYHTLPEDASLILDGETGEIRIKNADGTIEPVKPPYTLNPVLANHPKTVYERAADQLSWKDITERVLALDRHRPTLYERAGFSQDAAYDALQEHALQELVTARQGLEPEPIATIGVVTYLERLRQIDPSAGHLVTRNYTALK